jgi:hypothetical protein
MIALPRTSSKEGLNGYIEDWLLSKDEDEEEEEEEEGEWLLKKMRSTSRNF